MDKRVFENAYRRGKRSVQFMVGVFSGKDFGERVSIQDGHDNYA
jgi:hypothetical protein